ncbi:hypothetical protein U9M48_023716 [Paspalum notatum var. saurae]|uniref:Retrovirus-related Pol polyprotein from transposon TNT 1-94-like beta-barrel domain-containing protein n=1 Tax=Paspalum notatum var. saurae TaxID=547442 RepID=A0AAQ3WWD7_PASNO
MRDRFAGGERGGDFQARAPGGERRFVGRAPSHFLRGYGPRDQGFVRELKRPRFEGRGYFSQDGSALDRGMEDVWIMDSGCSRQMTGHHKWFSSLNPVSTKEYITFGDNGQGKVLGVGSVSLSAKLSLREVAYVQNLGFNLVSVSQLLDEDFEVRFKKDACRVLDAETLVFRVDLTSISGPARCLVASPSADIWKWQRLGLPKLKAEKDLVCHPCRHGKMVAASHTPVSQVMTSYPGELLHMDTVGPTRVASVSGKWYVLNLVLRLRNESHKAMRAIRSDNGGEFRNSRFENFCATYPTVERCRGTQEPHTL